MGVVQGATTTVTVRKLAYDGETVLDEITVDYEWMEDNLPVYGDGVTHYYHQGPVFVDQMEERWNPEEDQNCYPEKDMGAVKGTNLKDLCDLVGGMSEGEELRVKASDGLTKYFAYENVYEYPSRQGPIVLTWYARWDDPVRGGYTGPDYRDGMRLVWFADTSENPWGEHVFGVWDWHESAAEEYWYYYYSGGEMYPTTTGLSVKYVSEITIFSDDEPIGSIEVTSSPAGASILLDGLETGEYTNSTLTDVPAGEHSVQVSLEGYAAVEDEWVTVSHGETVEVHFTLVPLTGSIEVTSDPAGGRVYLDGEDSGEVTPAMLTDVAVGSHLVEVRLAGYDTASSRVEVVEGVPAEVDIALSPSTGGDGGTDTSGYGGKSLFLYQKGTIRGTVAAVNVSGPEEEMEKGDEAVLTIPFALPGDATVEDARLYLYLSRSRNTREDEPEDPNIRVVVNDQEIIRDIFYTDEIDFEDEEYRIATACYDVTRAIRKTGDHEVVVTNRGGDDHAFALTGAMLVVVLQDDTLPELSYWIMEGCDAILADPEEDEIPDAARTLIAFDGDLSLSGVNESALMLFSTVLPGEKIGEHKVSFNDWEWARPFSRDDALLLIEELNALPFLKSADNEGAVHSAPEGLAGTYLENRNAVLLVRYGESVVAPTPGEEPGKTPGKEAGEEITPVEGCTYIHALNASEVLLTLPEDRFMLYLPEGTEIRYQNGSPAQEIWVEEIGENESWMYRIGPENASVTGDAVLIAQNISIENPIFAREGADGSWEEIPGTKVEEARAWTGITRFGNFTLIDAPEPAKNPMVEFLEGIWPFILSLLSGGEGEAERPAWENAPRVILSCAGPETEESSIPENATFAFTLQSSPAGARIFLNGTYTGKVTPYTFEGLRHEEYLVRVDREGFVPEERVVMLNQTRTLCIGLSAENGPALNDLCFIGCISEEVLEATGGVYVTSSPDKADIYVDGRKTGRTTPEVITGLREGKHTIRVAKEKMEFPVDSKKVWVYGGALVPLHFDQAYRIDHEVTIDSEVREGAEFSVDGRFPSYKFPATITVSGTGSYITFHEDDRYTTVPLSVWMEGETVSVDMVTERYGTLRVDSKPQGAEIFVDGFTTGYHTPWLVRNVSYGRHRVMVSLPGHHPDEEEILFVPDWHEVDAKLEFSLDHYIYGSLGIASNPEGAKVYLLQTYTGLSTPATIHYLGIGTYEVGIVGEKGSKTVDATIMPYRVTVINVTLTEEE
ncbi:MAG: PEGA domain-containing protein [Methanomicrobiaceae archaeon]|nr:PEGA domain-containing protein [Methanomicrobiaceae archaeon]